MTKTKLQRSLIHFLVVCPSIFPDILVLGYGNNERTSFLLSMKSFSLFAAVAVSAFTLLVCLAVTEATESDSAYN
jgi:hypothetical protein